MNRFDGPSSEAQLRCVSDGVRDPEALLATIRYALLRSHSLQRHYTNLRCTGIRGRGLFSCFFVSDLTFLEHLWNSHQCTVLDSVVSEDRLLTPVNSPD